MEKWSFLGISKDYDKILKTSVIYKYLNFQSIAQLSCQIVMDLSEHMQGTFKKVPTYHNRFHYIYVRLLG